MELNRQIYKTENDVTYDNSIYFNNNGLTTFADYNNYSFNQDYNKMPDISFAYAMSKGPYSPHCNFRVVATNLNVNPDVSKIQITNYKQPYAYCFVNRTQSMLQNTPLPIGLFGSYAIRTNPENENTNFHSWGKGTLGTAEQALFFSRFSPAIKFNYQQFAFCPHFICSSEIDYAIRYNRTGEKELKLNEMTENYKYVSGIKMYPIFYKGTMLTGTNSDFNFFGINNIKITTYKTSGITNVDIEPDNKAVNDISFQDISFVGGSTPTQGNTIGVAINTAIRCPKPFEVLANSSKKYFGTIAPYTATEDFKRLISCYGLIWCDDEKYIVSNLNENTINEHYYIPVRNSEGFYTGDYLQGEKAIEYLNKHPELNTTDQWQINNGVAVNPDVRDYTDNIDLNKPTLSTIGVFNRSYAMNFNDILNLSNYIWNDDDNVFNQIVESLKLFGENPINALISLRLYPFDIDNKLGSTAVEKIKLGRIVTTVNGKALPNNIDCVFDLGETEFPNYHNNFLDYSPYTECELIIPYCGNLAIPPQEFIGKTLSIKLVVDFNLGACTAVIFADGIPKLYKNGNIGAEIAMSSNISADYGKNWLNASVGAVSNISSIASGNLVSAAGSATELTKAYTQPTIIQSVGGNSSTVNNWLPQKAYLIVRTSENKEPDNYGATVGYACSFNEVLQNLHGYTVVSNPQINFKCSSAENEEIKRILQNGFYI